MDIGTIIILNLSTIPFISEFEWIARSKGARPSLSQVLTLSNFRRQRWAIGFAVLWAIFLALALSSSKPHPVNLEVLALVLIFQGACWGLALYRTGRYVKENKR